MKKEIIISNLKRLLKEKDANSKLVKDTLKTLKGYIGDENIVKDFEKLSELPMGEFLTEFIRVLEVYHGDTSFNKDAMNNYIVMLENGNLAHTQVKPEPFTISEVDEDYKEVLTEIMVFIRRMEGYRKGHDCAYPGDLAIFLNRSYSGVVKDSLDKVKKATTDSEVLHLLLLSYEKIVMSLI